MSPQVGIFDRPTLVHNVETLHWVARICREGPEVLNAVEKNGRKGLRSYSVSGRVARPGVHLLAGRLDHHRHHRGRRRHGRRPRLQGLSAGRAVLGAAAGLDRRCAARFRHAATAWHLHRLGRRGGAVGPGQRPGRSTQHAALFRGESPAASAPPAGSAARRRSS